MADINQAARWLTEGKKVCRSRYIPDCWIEYSDLHNVWLHYLPDRIMPGMLLQMDDLLAEDWELYQGTE